eukprot:6157666-Alexandrium_andersonii.AAC.1
MSASLVGSEMCIRDRASWPHVAGSPEPGVDQGGHSAADPGNGLGLLAACLLYTSDAADDM